MSKRYSVRTVTRDTEGHTGPYQTRGDAERHARCVERRYRNFRQSVTIFVDCDGEQPSYEPFAVVTYPERSRR